MTRKTSESKFNVAIVNELVGLRAKRGLTVEQLAQRSGLTFGTLRNILRGKIDVQMADLLLIVKALDGTIEQVVADAFREVGGEDEALSDVRSIVDARRGTGDELAAKRRTKAAADMSVEELEGERHAATRDSELDSDEPELP